MTTNDLMQLSEERKSSLNRAWVEWVAQLPAWKLHWLFAREMDLYDAYEAGQIDIGEIETLMARAFNEDVAENAV